MGGQAKSKKKTKDKRKNTCSNRDSGLAFLSAEERLKLKMQERNKKKTAEKYSVKQLLEKTEECMDSFDFEMASRFCQRALELEPNNQQTLDMLGHIHSELGDMQRAKAVFLRAVELSPDEGHSKYMSLGQLHTGQEAVNYYTRGIQIILAALERQMLNMTEAGAVGTATPDPDLEPLVRKDVCVAYCSVAEIYLTDLCMEDGAGDKCREAIESALQHHHDNPEALQLMASYLFSTEKNQEGRDYLMRSVGAWLPSLKQSDALPPSRDMEEEPTQNEIPPYETRITTAKLLMESEEYEMAVDVLEGLLEEDDEVVQVWYLSGWVCCLQKERAAEQRVREGKEAGEEEREEAEALREAARSYLTKAKKLYSKLRCDDPPMLEHVEQLLGELGGEVEEREEEGAGAALDQEFEPCSDEEEEDEEEEAAAMEH